MSFLTKGKKFFRLREIWKTIIFFPERNGEYGEMQLAKRGANRVLLHCSPQKPVERRMMGNSEPAGELW